MAAGDVAAIRRDVQTFGEHLRLPLAAELRPSPDGRSVRIAVTGGDKPVSFELLGQASSSIVSKGAGLGAAVTLHSPFGYGERIFATFLPGRRDELNAFVGPGLLGIAGIAVPLGRNGLVAEFSHSVGWDSRRFIGTDLAGNVGSFMLGQTTHRTSVKLEQALITWSNLRVLARIGFDATVQYSELTRPAFPLWRDETRVLRFGLDLVSTPWSGATFEAQGEVSQGLALLGARQAPRDPAAAPLSRPGASPAFTKADLRVKLRQGLGHGFFVEATGRATTAFGKALSFSEQTPLLHTSSTSRIAPDTVFADSAVQGRLEAGRTFELALPIGPVTLEPYAFAAAGRAFLHQPTVDERRTTDGTALGGGLRLEQKATPGLPATQVSFEIGRYRSNGGLPNHTLATVQLSLRF